MAESVGIAIVCTARPSYAKLQPVIAALLREGHTPTLYLTNSALLVRFGDIITQVRQDCPFCPIIPIHAEFDGYSLDTSAKSTAALLSSLADAFAWNRPPIVIVNHDRREVLAVAQAAAYQNIPVAHIGGGEQSGNIDDRVRDAVTCLSTYHFVATQAALIRVRQLKSDALSQSWWTGCPSIDVAMEASADALVTNEELGGLGPTVVTDLPFLLVLQHASTECPDEAFAQMMMTLEAVKAVEMPTIVIWPGADAGAEGTSKAIRLHQSWCRTVRTLPPRRFLKLLSQAKVLIGNSSAGIREASFLGTPVVNIGHRQHGRACASNVSWVPHAQEAIRAAIAYQAWHAYRPSTLYGTGWASMGIAKMLLCRI